jgi:hypothetical protein
MVCACAWHVHVQVYPCCTVWGCVVLAKQHCQHTCIARTLRPPCTCTLCVAVLRSWCHCCARLCGAAAFYGVSCHKRKSIRLAFLPPSTQRGRGRRTGKRTLKRGRLGGTSINHPHDTNTHATPRHATPGCCAVTSAHGIRCRTRSVGVVDNPQLLCGFTRVLVLTTNRHTATTSLPCPQQHAAVRAGTLRARARSTHDARGGDTALRHHGG